MTTLGKNHKHRYSTRKQLVLQYLQYHSKQKAPESKSHLCLKPPAIPKYLDSCRTSKWNASSITCSTSQLAVTVMRVVTFFFYSWGMRAESFNLGFIWFWTQKSLSSVWCSLMKLSTFYVLTVCCCESNGSRISVSNLSKPQFLGSNPKAMKVKGTLPPHKPWIH